MILVILDPSSYYVSVYVKSCIQHPRPAQGLQNRYQTGIQSSLCCNPPFMSLQNDQFWLKNEILTQHPPSKKKKKKEKKISDWTLALQGPIRFQLDPVPPSLAPPLDQAMYCIANSSSFRHQYCICQNQQSVCLSFRKVVKSQESLGRAIQEVSYWRTQQHQLTTIHLTRVAYRPASIEAHQPEHTRQLKG